MLAELARRVRRLEDELEIQRLIVRYGIAVDVGDADAVAGCFTPDGTYEVDGAYVAGGGPLVLEGRGALRAMIDGERHRALRPRCAHTLGPTTVRVDGDVAHGHGYSRVYWGTGDEAVLHRLSTNRWRFERHAGTWLIAARRSVAMGSAAAQQALAGALGQAPAGPSNQSQV